MKIGMSLYNILILLVILADRCYWHEKCYKFHRYSGKIRYIRAPLGLRSIKFAFYEGDAVWKGTDLHISSCPV